MKKIEITDQAWLQELDPDKYYVLMFTGYPDDIKWDDKPANVSAMLLNADHYTLQDLDKARAALLPEERTSGKDGTDAS